MTLPAAGTPASRLAALLLLALLLFAGWRLVGVGWLDARASLDAELTTTARLRDRFFRIDAAPPPSAGSALIAAPTADIAASVLQTELEAMIEDAGGTAERLEAVVLPRRRGTARLEAVQVSAGFSATVAQLRALLLSADAGPLALAVDELAIRVPGGEADEGIARPADGRLEIMLVVRGFRLRERTRR